MDPVEAWAIVDKDGNLVDVRKKRLSYVADAKLRVRVWRLDVEHPSRAPHTAVKGEWRPTNDVAR